MAVTTRPLSGMDERFKSVRGRKEDYRWFARAVLYLLNEGVDAEHARDAFGHVLTALAECDEPISELFGTPESWGEQWIRQWREDGVDAIRPEAHSLRDLVVAGCALSCLMSVLAALASVASVVGGVYPIAMAVVPALISFACVGGLGVYQHLIRVVPFIATIAACAGFVVVTAVASAAMMWLMQVIPVPSAPLWYGMVPAALLFGMATWLIGRFWTDGNPQSGLKSDELFEEDSAWLCSLAGALRARGDVPGWRIRRICDDARRFAGESGSRLVDEFGPAEIYAQRFQRSSFKELRFVWLWLVLLVFDGVGLVWSDYDAGQNAVSRVTWIVLVVVSLQGVLRAIASWRRQRVRDRPKSVTRH